MPTEPLSPDSVRRLAEEAKLVFGPAWDQDRAVALHEQIERLAELAEAAGRAELSAVALELFVFACSLVDLGRPPGDAVYAELVRLCDGLSSAATARKSASGKSAPVRHEPSRTPGVVLLSAPGESLHELAGELGRAQYRVDRAESLEELSARLAQRTAELVVMTASSLGRAADVLPVVDAACQGRLDRPVLVMLLNAEDVEGRMYAMRAGIDHVVELRGAGDVVQALLECARRRRRAAFKVWVVEDDRSQAMFVRSVLGYRGIDVDLAENAEQALALCEQGTPDLVLLDLHLPDRNGIELAQILRERPGFEWVQIVFLSGESDREEQIRAIRLGADDWVAKPVRPRHLLSVVESRAVRARAMRERAGQELPETIANRREQWLHETQLMLGRQPVVPWVLVALRPTGEGLDGLSFVQTGALLAEMVQAAASLPGCRSQVRTVNDSTVLFLVEAEAARESALTDLRGAWNRRRWLGGDRERGFDWALAAFALAAGETRIESGLQRIFVLLDHATGKAERIAIERSTTHTALDLPPAWTALLASPAAPKHGAAMMLRFQPLQPVRGSLRDQYFVGPRWRLETGFEVGHEEVVKRALDTGRLEAVERAVLGQCLQWQSDTAGKGRPVLPWVKVSLETARGERLPAWLRAEATRRGARLSDMTLAFSMSEVRAHPAIAERAWARLAELGVRIALAGIRPADASLGLIRSSGLHSLLLDWSEDDPEWEQALPKLVKMGREYGKTVAVAGVDHARTLTALFARPVHYLMGAAVSEELVAPTFDFSTQ